MKEITMGQLKDSIAPRRLNHVLHADQFDRPLLEHLCRVTDAARKLDKTREGLMHLKNLLPHRRAMLYFTQPSTRTFLSFQSACQILGVQTSEIRDASTSSERKGETVEDSLRTFSSYVDLIIMRTPMAGLCDRMASLLDETPRPVPIMNGGSGPDQHPTQAVLDIYTLTRSFKEQGGIDGKTIVMVGDMKNGRTIRSLSHLLTLYKNVRMIFVSPPEFKMGDDLRKILTLAGSRFEETDNFLGAIHEADAIYMTRVQDEYDPTGRARTLDISRFSLKHKHMEGLKPHCVIMHPLPRREELDPAIDSDPRAKYWRQERNGMWTRVALITMLMGVDHHLVLPEL
jgi:aspartate carbamoyltransferase catalytic subunit